MCFSDAGCIFGSLSTSIYNFCRLDEIIYNSLRVGQTSVTSGFEPRDHLRHLKLCPRCGGIDSTRHFLLECPAGETARERLRNDVFEEFQREELEREERNLQRGKLFKPRRWRGLGMADIGNHPRSILKFIQRQTIWIDGHAKREEADGTGDDFLSGAGDLDRRAKTLPVCHTDECQGFQEQFHATGDPQASRQITTKIAETPTPKTAPTLEDPRRTINLHWYDGRVRGTTAERMDGGT